MFGRMREADQVWTVSALTQYIRELFEVDFRLQDVQVSGEVSNFTRARSGHLYFTLKDGGAQLRCVMWRAAAARLLFEPQEGDAVVAQGRVSVYEASGVYQLYVERLSSAGIGDLALAFERLKQQLAAEGLFDEAHKQPVPPFPRRIGVVTSPDAAALRDILNVLRRRWPLVSVLISPTLVQGNEAPAQIVQALRRLDERDDVDTILIARGGGSIEDLWAFNDEAVVRAVYNARHPIISGVGHETDFTLTDFAADVRAPTPSAAAELAVPDSAELRPFLREQRARLDRLVMAWVRDRRQQLAGLRRSLDHLSPQGRLDSNRQRLDGLTIRLDQAGVRGLELARARLALAQGRLQAVSPLATLSRGYAIVRHADGAVVRTVTAVARGDRLRVQVVDGRFAVVVEES